jgi:hypothetical protein
VCLPSLVFFRRSAAPGVSELAFTLLLPLPYATEYINRTWIVTAMMMALFVIVALRPLWYALPVRQFKKALLYGQSSSGVEGGERGRQCNLK